MTGKGNSREACMEDANISEYIYSVFSGVVTGNNGSSP
jgi:hypothetical protein